MFIKVTMLNGASVLVNGNIVRTITEHKTPDKTFCRMHFDIETTLDVKQSLIELEGLLEANSIEKQIANLKMENDRTRAQSFATEQISNAMRGSMYAQDKHAQD